MKGWMQSLFAWLKKVQSVCRLFIFVSIWTVLAFLLQSKDYLIHVIVFIQHISLNIEVVVDEVKR